MPDVLCFEVKGKVIFDAQVTTEPMIAITSDGQVLEVPVGTPIPKLDSISVLKKERSE